MPRIPRMYLKTEFFHIITQGINKSFIFDSPDDIKYYIKNMYKYANECDVKIIAYCIMNNHAHILINTLAISNMSNFMHKLNTKYAYFYNKKYKRVGYLFRDRYKSEGIYSEQHLNNCIKYIYNNPVKAKICNKPNEYPYSNYKKIDVIEQDINYSFLDVIEDDSNLCQNLINEYLEQNMMTLEELKNAEKHLHRLLLILKRDNGISLRKIAICLNISREKIRKIYNNFF